MELVPLLPRELPPLPAGGEVLAVQPDPFGRCSLGVPGEIVGSQQVAWLSSFSVSYRSERRPLRDGRFDQARMRVEPLLVQRSEFGILVVSALCRPPCLA